MFVGGICLLKVYNLISWMLEDIDIKVIFLEVLNIYKLKNECLFDKVRLKDIYKKLIIKLEELGFYFIDKEGENFEINDRYCYYNVDLSY